MNLIKLGFGVVGVAALATGSYFGYKKYKAHADAKNVTANAAAATLITAVHGKTSEEVDQLGDQLVGLTLVKPVEIKVDAEETASLVHTAPVVVVEKTPIARIIPGGGAAEVFDTFFRKLEGDGKLTPFSTEWGVARKGYRGLIRINPLPGFRCAIDETSGDRLIYSADKNGRVVVVYEYDDKIVWSSGQEVEVTFKAVELDRTDMVDFTQNTFRVPPEGKQA